MIEQEKRKAIYHLNKEGMSIREISRRLGVNKNTVKNIVKQKGEMHIKTRADNMEIDEELLRKLYTECDGKKQRIFEKITEEAGIKIKYSTLTGKIRELGLSQDKNERSYDVPEVAGEESQHDTSDYWIKIGDKRIKVIGSMLYFRYCKLRYVKFYRSFNRFAMKCFLHEAFKYFGYAANKIIIDNTSLARLRGTGKNAVIVPEMKKFAEQYCTEFVCHEKDHPNRKAGVEKSFHIVTTNFLPGRTFSSLEDLNRQVFLWATERMANRPVSKSGLIPAQAFLHEKSYLKKLNPYIPAPYEVLKRDIDQYGYVPVDANYYWVPGTKRGEVLVLHYGSILKIYQNRITIAEYTLPPDGVKNEPFFPNGMERPKYQPNDRKKPTEKEEKALRAASVETNAYLDFVLNTKGIQKHNFIRHIFTLYQKLALPIFEKTIERIHKYRITDLKTIERIALLQLAENGYQLPTCDFDAGFKDREAYKEGYLCDAADLSRYEKLLEDEKDE